MCLLSLYNFNTCKIKIENACNERDAVELKKKVNNLNTFLQNSHSEDNNDKLVAPFSNTVTQENKEITVLHIL